MKNRTYRRDFILRGANVDEISTIIVKPVRALDSGTSQMARPGWNSFLNGRLTVLSRLSYRSNALTPGSYVRSVSDRPLPERRSSTGSAGAPSSSPRAWAGFLPRVRWASAAAPPSAKYFFFNRMIRLLINPKPAAP